MLSTIDRLTDLALTLRPWTSAVGLARSLIALSGLTTIGFTPLAVLIRPASGLPDPLACQDVVKVTLWCQLPEEQLWIGKAISLVVLFAVLIGWRPSITALPFAWVMFSMNAGLTVVDGGDQVAYVLSVILIPISLTDPRRWHWTDTTVQQHSHYSPYRRMVAVIGVWMAQVQVSYIYLNACLTKLSSKEWIDGTSVYYWFTHPMLGAPGYLQPLAELVTFNAFGVSFITWSVLVLEFTLGISMLVRRLFITPLFVGGALFHTGIALLFGLWSFALVMFGALTLLLMPHKRAFSELVPWRRRLTHSSRDTRSPEPSRPSLPGTLSIAKAVPTTRSPWD